MEDVLQRAAEMGLDIASEEFWELRPDNFITMFLAHRKVQQETMFPLRRIMSILSSTAAGKYVPEEPLLPLNLVDVVPLKKGKEAKSKKEQIEEQKKKYTPEYVAQLEEEHRKRMQRKKELKNRE